MERFAKDGAFKERCNGNIPYAEIVRFVSKVEDLLEELGIESVEELKRILTTNAVWQENQALKERWEDLKKFIEKDLDWNLERGNNDCALGQRWVLDKIEELEKED